MKLDKEILIGVAICGVILFAWDPFCRAMGWSSEPVPQQSVETAAPTAQPSKKDVVKSDTVKQEKSIAAAAPAQKLAQLPIIKIENDDVIFSIDQINGDVKSIELKKYKNSKRDGNVILDSRSGTEKGAFAVFPKSGNWKTLNVAYSAKSSDSKSFKLVRLVSCSDFPQGIFVEQNWTLDGYTAKYSVKFANNSKNHVKVANAAVSGGLIAPWSSASGDKVRIPTHRLDYYTAHGDFEDIKADAKDSKFFRSPAPAVDWAGVSNKYFCSIIDAKEPFTLWQSRSYIKDGDNSVPAIAAGVEIPGFELAPGEVRSFDFNTYNGPKIISLLDAFNPSTGKVMHLAWGPLDYLARLLLWILVKFNDVLHSYGWSIICLTIVVRLLFYPVTAKANASMKKMQQVQPQLAALREKYKDNPQLLNTKMMELYRQEGVNPFGGCLPILLQIPVFFALYATLDGAVELRQVAFWWCKDLAAADTVARIPLYFFDLPINPLVLAMTLLMAIQQHMTPMSGDPMQKKMMMMMPVIMLVFLYDLPSGLTLYWTVSNLFSIIQLKLQQRARKVSAAAK
ncbi:MAG: membrane protein insertase YidC [Lentisphaeria bacterium]|nr:membrane protein insertase YidC [Lentisphaeria bacterium]